MTHVSDRINKLAEKYHYTRYLEIGVCRGDTFLAVNMPHKTAVDPHFLFDTKANEAPLTQYFSIPSDTFFAELKSKIGTFPYTNSTNNKDVCMPSRGGVSTNTLLNDLFAFDIIYIDGLHTFEQSYRDFINSIPFSHDKTIWIFDDTIPCDPWSAIPDQKKSYRFRKIANLAGRPWHGDVFKTVFAIHDFNPEYRYVTYTDVKNPQTILWKTKHPEQRQPIFGEMKKIATMSYFDMLEINHVLVSVSEKVALELLWQEFDTDHMTTPDAGLSLVAKPLMFNLSQPSKLTKRIRMKFSRFLQKLLDVA